SLRRTSLVLPLPFGIACLVSDLSKLPGIPTRRRDGGEIVGDAIDLIEELLARFVVIFLAGDGDRLVAIEAVQRLEVRVDSDDLAGGVGAGPGLPRRGETAKWHFRMVGAAVDRPSLHLLGHVLPNARAAPPFLLGVFLMGDPPAQRGKDALLREDHAMRAQPP